MIPEITTSTLRLIIDIDIAPELYQHHNQAHWEAYIAHVFHHEIFHLLDFIYSLDYQSHSHWRELNHAHVPYRESEHDGYEARGKNTNLDTSFQQWNSRRGALGFISNYARVNPLEDRADIYGYFMMEDKGQSERFKRLVASDSIINEKVSELENFLRSNITSW